VKKVINFKERRLLRPCR